MKVLLEIKIRCLRESIKHLTEFFPSPNNKAEGSFENLPRLTCLVSYSLNASVLNYTVQFSNKIIAVVAKPNQEHKIFQLKNENPLPLLISKVWHWELSINRKTTLRWQNIVQVKYLDKLSLIIITGKSNTWIKVTFLFNRCFPYLISILER